MIGIIGGTGLGALASLDDLNSEHISTAYGESYLEFGRLQNEDVVFLPRHGHPPNCPPHRINYRANIQALKQCSVSEVFAIAAVGSVDPGLEVADFVVPDQLLDYTSGRGQTFFDDEIEHIDFTNPYTPRLREQLIAACHSNERVSLVAEGVYGCTNGPRLETAAEIQRMYRDGCTVVGMTGMPEAALAREAGLDYACLSIVVNKGAGLDGELDLAEISSSLNASMEQVVAVLTQVVNG